MAFIYPFQFTGTRWRLIDGDVYVSHLGSDLSGNGSPRKPFKTIQQAINAASTGARIVVGTGSYNESVNGQGKSCKVVADGTVVMTGPAAATAFTNMGSNSSVQGFSIAGYQIAVNGAVKELVSCSIRSALSAFTGTLRSTILLNTTISGSAPVRLINCTLIGVTSASSSAITYLESCALGSTTSLQLSTPALTYFDYCNQEPGSVIQINGTPYNTPSAVNGAFPAFQQHGLGVASAFNSPATGDYTLSPASPLKTAGRRKMAIGAGGEAAFVGTQQILSGGSIAAVTINSSNYFELPVGISMGTIETPVMDLGSIRPVRNLRLYADQTFDESILQVVSADDSPSLPGAITVEMRYADDPSGIAAAVYQPMIWDKIVSHDHRLAGNGQLAFKVITASYITTRCMQFRITLRSAGDIVFLTQENNDLLLQEDERQLRV
jgi:hypothetical protein